MKFKEELKYIDLTFKHFLEKVSIDEIKFKLKKDGLYDLDIDNVLRAAKSKLLDKYEDEIIPMVLDFNFQNIANQLPELHASTIDYLIESARDRLKQKERIKVKQLLYNNLDLKDILNSVRLDIYPQKEVEDQVSRYEEKYQEAGEKRNWNVYGGLFMLSIFAFTLLDDSWGRPLYLLGISGVVLIYRGININTGKKNTIK